MNTFAHLLGYLVDLFTALLGSVLLLRAWVYAQAIPTADPIARFCIALTDWLVLPVAKTMRASGKWHWPAILSAFGVLHPLASSFRHSDVDSRSGGVAFRAPDPLGH